MSRSHAHLYNENGEFSAHAATSTKYPERPKKPAKEKKDHRFRLRRSKKDDENTPVTPNGSEKKGLVVDTTDLEAQRPSPIESTASSETEGEEVPQLTPWVAFGLLVVVTVVGLSCSDPFRHLTLILYSLSPSLQSSWLALSMVLLAQEISAKNGYALSTSFLYGEVVPNGVVVTRSASFFYRSLEMRQNTLQL